MHVALLSGSIRRAANSARRDSWIRCAYESFVKSPTIVPTTSASVRCSVRDVEIILKTSVEPF